MRRLALWAANLSSGLLPLTHCFGLRRRAYRAAGVTVEPGAQINGNTRITYPNVHIGVSWIGAGTQIISTPAARVTIGDRCDIGPDVMFVTGSHRMGDGHRRAGKGFSESITVGSGTWIGARATFLAGSSVGKGCFVAPCSLVRDQFPDNVMLAGVPAKLIRKFES